MPITGGTLTGSLTVEDIVNVTGETKLNGKVTTTQQLLVTETNENDSAALVIASNKTASDPFLEYITKSKSIA